MLHNLIHDTLNINVITDLKHIANAVLKDKLYHEDGTMKFICECINNKQDPLDDDDDDISTGYVGAMISDSFNTNIAVCLLSGNGRGLSTFVLPEYRGRGYGSAVVNHLLRINNINPKSVYGCDGPDSPAKSFYENIGCRYFEGGCIRITDDELKYIMQKQGSIFF